VTSVNEANQKRVVSVFSSWNEEKSLAELRHFFVQVGSARIPGKIDQEKKLVHVDVPFEMNFERTMISWGGPHRSYSENYVQDHFYDMRDTIEFDIHSADSSTKAIYKVTVAYNPDAFKPAPDTTAKDTTVKDTTKKDTIEAIVPRLALAKSFNLTSNGSLVSVSQVARKPFKVQVFDLTGKLVQELKSEGLDLQFKIQSKGVFRVRVMSARASEMFTVKSY
jgi:hypothetical protein